ncbi:Gx transporter family protein [Candidatus Dependentiae bacterium]|nr:Gx transporter family protein [Candidatus Dependentiae bacterium]
MELQNDKIKIYIFSIVLTTILYVTESLIPKPFPWIRIGLSNIIFMLLLKKNEMNLSEIYLILLFRNILSSVTTGTLISPLFIISLISSAGSILAMYIFFKILKDNVSFISVSVIGAVVNIIIQLLTGSLIIFQNTVLLKMSPYFLMFAAVSGIITGIITNKLFNKLVEKKFSLLVSQKI